MLHDYRLKRAYSVLEIATLATGCQGNTQHHRVEEAIQLLAMVEKRATNPNPNNVLAGKILAAAKRDEKSGNIKRTSLTLETCLAAGCAKTLVQAQRRYKEWLQFELDVNLPDVESLEILTSLWEYGDHVKLIRSDEIAFTIACGFLAWLKHEGSDYANYYGKPNKGKRIRSRKEGSKGKLVSPKTRGAQLDAGNKFSR